MSSLLGNLKQLRATDTMNDSGLRESMIMRAQCVKHEFDFQRGVGGPIPHVPSLVAAGEIANREFVLVNSRKEITDRSDTVSRAVAQAGIDLFYNRDTPSFFSRFLSTTSVTVMVVSGQSLSDLVRGNTCQRCETKPRVKN